ncbi:MAG: oligoendopeptidase [Fimbriimonadaceae bacterium]|jgi:oligoendopeptidase F|nr:oligoendopeptidase [Fimbriimonadaceae bacterium]
MSIVEEVPPPPAVRWDLSDLFRGLDDPGIQKSWDDANRRADDFAKAYRGKIDSPTLDPSTFATALKEFESLWQEASKPVVFAHLLFAANTSDAQIGAFLQKQNELSTALSVKMMFFELELQAAPEEAIQRCLKDPALSNYRHYIHVARAFSRHRLSESEEVILEETANTGVRAWERLFDEVTANYTYKLRMPGGETKESTEQEVLALLRNPDRGLRQAAADAFTEGLTDLKRVLTLNFNNILLDKAVKDRLRKHPYPEHSRHLANELDKDTVDLVIRLCRANYGLVERFYKVKREILGLPELTHIDRYAPLFETKEHVDWDRAKRIVLDSFSTFSHEMSERAEEFFDKSWIDAEPRKGKTGGAFCSYMTPDTHPVILQSYLNKMDDVMTLAHELGHGVHASLSRAQTYFNYHGTLPLAELASTFGEMLVFERLVGEADLRDKLALYASKVEGVFATVFRQAAMFRFEQRCHEERRAKGELAWERISEIWHEEIQAMFGSSVHLGEQHRCWWSYIGHFVGSPFYVYAYSFGELLVLSLYQMAKQQGPAFADKYIELLKAGGSLSPAELMAMVGVDLKSEAFWHGGFDAMEKLVAEFERLWGEYKRR